MVQRPVAERLGAFAWVSQQLWQASWYGVDADERCRAAIAKQLQVNGAFVVEFCHFLIGRFMTLMGSSNRQSACGPRIYWTYAAYDCFEIPC